MSALRDDFADRPTLKTALGLREKNFWPILVNGKKPIGDEWGLIQLSAEEIIEGFQDNPTANVGLILGAIAGIIDVEIDDLETGPATLLAMMGGPVETLGWSSSRGPHHLFAFDDRLRKYEKTKHEIDGVEIRIGTLDPENVVQMQSVCPPSLQSDGTPRQWNGVRTIATLPECFFEFMDRHCAKPDLKIAPRTRTADGGISTARQRYALSALDKEIDALESASEGTRNDQLNEAAFKLGTLVGAGVLDRETVASVLEESALRIGLNHRETLATIRSGLGAGEAEPRDLSRIGADPTIRGVKPSTRSPRVAVDPDAEPDPLDEDATAMDLIRLNSTIRWLWENWIPTGVLTILAAEPGCGKTRLCADLLRRINHGLPWPDGSPMTLDPDSCVLWVPADNQHPELGTFPSTFGFDPERLILNATKRNPYTGTMLDHPDDLEDFEARIVRRKPVMVFIDTSLNATDRSSHKPEDAKAFFKPLQEIATRTQTAIICVTHLNAGGKPLGRRITGQGRVVIQLEKPDPDNQPHRRKLYVTKSNAMFPVALGVTMAGDGNEYDDHPPVAPEPDAHPPQKAKVSRLEECVEWLREQLDVGNGRVSDIRTESDAKGFSSKTLYSARDRLRVYEFELEGRKWWQLTDDTPEF